MKKRKVCLWQFKPSLHQLALVEALYKQCELTWVIEQPVLDSSRANMGWFTNTNVPYETISDFTSMQNFVNGLDNDVIHVFGGLRSSKNLNYSLSLLLTLKRRVYIQTEAPNYFGFKGFLRIIRGYIDNFKYYKNIQGVFAIGSLGINFYQKILFDPAKVFKWGYFVKSNQYVSLDFNQSNLKVEDVFHMIFVGRLIKTKGVDVLLKSLLNISYDFKLTIIGNGPEEKYLKNIVYQSNLLKNKVEFFDFMKNEKVLNQIANSDLLVLPSIGKDGWGAVVSEALMQGTPVVASERCGSAVLINDNRGQVFRTNSVKSLAFALKKQIRKGVVNTEVRNNIKNWSKSITGEVAAKYMLDVIDNKHPEAPWLN